MKPIKKETELGSIYLCPKRKCKFHSPTLHGATVHIKLIHRKATSK